MLGSLGYGARRAMAKAETALIIKRYGGSRLYNPGAAAYVTLAELANRVEDEQEFVVTEAETGEDITQSVLKQIIVERRRHG